MDPVEQVEGFPHLDPAAQAKIQSAINFESMPQSSVAATIPSVPAAVLKFEAADAGADAEGEAEVDADGEEETAEPVPKRQRLDEPDLTETTAMDDEGLLQLAAHSAGAPSDHYTAE